MMAMGNFNWKEFKSYVRLNRGRNPTGSGKLDLLIVCTKHRQLLVELIVCKVARGAAGRRMERGQDAWTLRSPRKGGNGESLFAPLY